MVAGARRPVYLNTVILGASNAIPDSRDGSIHRIELCEVQSPVEDPVGPLRLAQEMVPGRCGGAPNAAIVANVQRASVTCKAKAWVSTCGAEPPAAVHQSRTPLWSRCGPDDGMQARATRVNNRGLFYQRLVPYRRNTDRCRNPGRAHERNQLVGAPRSESPRWHWWTGPRPIDLPRQTWHRQSRRKSLRHWKEPAL